MVVINLNSDDDEDDFNQSRASKSLKPVLCTRRWFVLAAYCLLTTSNLSSWYAFSAISNIMQRYYNINLVQVNWLAMAVSIVTLCYMLPSYYLLEKIGLAMTMVLAGFSNALGWTVRYTGYSVPVYGYWFLMIGGILCSISTSAFLFLPSKIAAVWFGEKERATATSIAIAADSLGMALSYILPTYTVRNSLNVANIGADLGTFLLISAIQGFLTFAVVCLTVRDQPLMAPSSSESRKHSENNGSSLLLVVNGSSDEAVPQMHFIPQKMVGYKQLLKNRHFHTVLNIHGIIDGIESALLISLNEILIGRFPSYEHEIGWMGSIGLILSIPTNCIIGAILDRTRAFKRITIVTTGLCCIFSAAFSALSYFNASFYLLFVTYLAIVATYSTYYTTAFDHCAELTYPISEAKSGVVLLWVAQVYSLLFEQLASWLLYFVGHEEFLFCLSILFIITLLLSFIVKDKGPRSFLGSSNFV